MSVPAMTDPAITTAVVPGPAPQDEGRCPSCPHPLADHDPIGLRFCRATRSGDDRGCVCRTA